MSFDHRWDLWGFEPCLETFAKAWIDYKVRSMFESGHNKNWKISSVFKIPISIWAVHPLYVRSLQSKPALCQSLTAPLKRSTPPDDSNYTKFSKKIGWSGTERELWRRFRYLADETDLGVSLIGMNAIHRLFDSFRGVSLPELQLYLAPAVAQLDRLLDESQTDTELAALWLIDPTR